jgi:hypothetical protein
VEVLGLWDSLKRGEPALTIFRDLALAIGSVAGCCFLLLGVDSEGLRAAWKAVAPVLVAGSIVVSVIEVRDLDRNPEPDFSQREHYWLLLVGSGIAILSMVPILLANLVYAFAPHLWPAV